VTHFPPPKSPGETEEEYLVQLQAAASKRAGGQQQPVTRAHTPDEATARLAAGLPLAPPDLPPMPRRDRKKIQQADIPDVLPKPDSAAYHAELAKLAASRQKGNPLAANIAAVGRAVFYSMVTGIRQTLAQIARRAGCCVETARRCIIVLEDAGLFGVLNVLVWDGPLQLRAANLYLSPWCLDLTKRVAGRVAIRARDFLEHCGKIMGLAARTMGLNTTPLRQPGET
jgi:hypothetical protein